MSEENRHLIDEIRRLKGHHDADRQQWYDERRELKNSLADEIYKREDLQCVLDRNREDHEVLERRYNDVILENRELRHRGVESEVDTANVGVQLSPQNEVPVRCLTCLAISLEDDITEEGDIPILRENAQTNTSLESENDVEQLVHLLMEKDAEVARLIETNEKNTQIIKELQGALQEKERQSLAKTEYKSLGDEISEAGRIADRGLLQKLSMVLLENEKLNKVNSEQKIIIQDFETEKRISLAKENKFEETIRYYENKTELLMNTVKSITAQIKKVTDQTMTCLESNLEFSSEQSMERKVTAVAEDIDDILKYRDEAYERVAKCVADLKIVNRILKANAKEQKLMRKLLAARKSQYEEKVEIMQKTIDVQEEALAMFD